MSSSAASQRLCKTSQLETNSLNTIAFTKTKGKKQDILHPEDAVHSTSQLQVRLETDSIRVTGKQVKAAHTKLVSVAFNIQRGPPSVLLLWLVIRGATICCLSAESILTCLRPPDPKKLHICDKTLSICKISSILWNSCVLLRHLGKVHFLNH